MQPSFQCCGVTEDHGWKVWEKVGPTPKMRDESESGESGRTRGKAYMGFVKISFILYKSHIHAVEDMVIGQI